MEKIYIVGDDFCRASTIQRAYGIPSKKCKLINVKNISNAYNEAREQGYILEDKPVLFYCNTSEGYKYHLMKVIKQMSNREITNKVEKYHISLVLDEIN